ncbi:hypothetical protein AWB67_05548 [Caballeronia terrestris]|uniref:Uncharacterized protein n=1 Tax=Caballeronia terrestris TaxID=1226301 RepID=A0A158KFS2_9BURK|nr:hypothetical protein AWB67_05548 [Caballeronia terrestris]
MHLCMVRSFDEIWLVSIAHEQRLEFLVADAREDGRVRDLVAVQVENRQHGAVAHGIEKLVRMPRRGERPGFRFAVADHTGDDEVRIVERGTIRMRQAVAQFAAFVDRAGRLRRDMRTDVAGKRELLEKFLHALDVFALVRIHLRVGALKIGRTEHAGRPMPGASHEDHVEVVALDDPVQMRPCERQRRTRAPVTEQTLLDVIDLERLLQQGVVDQIDHADREVVARTPPRIDQSKLVGAEGSLL